MATLPGLFLLSCSTLVFEINLTRLFSVSQFYHFAFVVVSIALLGFGASGTALTCWPDLERRQTRRLLGWSAMASGISMMGAYLLTLLLPFDSFSMAWDRRQVWILALHYVALATPFFFSGMAVGLLLKVHSRNAGRVYAVNLFGSAAGCLLAFALPSLLGGEGVVVFSSGLALLAAAITLAGNPEHTSPSRKTGERLEALFAILLFTVLLLDTASRLSGQPALPGLELRLSPYKGISHLLQQPGSQIISQRWNAYSRIDLVRSSSIHSLPGLSFIYLEPLPNEEGLFVDGDDLSPVILPGQSTEFTEYVLNTLAFQLRPDAKTLILEPRGGLDVLTALAQGADHVTALESNPLIVAAAGEVYDHPQVRVILESGRSYLRRTSDRFDVILISLASSYHPVRSGAYSLSEDYRYTVEAFQDSMAALEPDGVLMVPRWLQMPPSESLRAFAIAVAALDRLGMNPENQIVALRSYNASLLLVKNGSFTQEEVQSIRDFARERAFDLTYAPGIQPEETNRFNRLKESTYYETFTRLLASHPREEFYEGYPYDVSPPTDAHPFFGHFFKWTQARQMISELGRVWQPFGGAGYFVILALLLLASILAAILILLPLAILRARENRRAVMQQAVTPTWKLRLILPYLVYFGLLGLAFLLVEIPLIQSFILYLGHPSYAMTTVLFSLLLFSGLGSHLSGRIPFRLALASLCGLLGAMLILLPEFIHSTLELPLSLRLGLAVAVLAPLGFLMGIPFPGGISWLTAREGDSGLVPWIWGVNGAASVVASILAALLALTFGFTVVLASGAVCYGGACLMARKAPNPSAQPPPR